MEAPIANQLVRNGCLTGFARLWGAKTEGCEVNLFTELGHDRADRARRCGVLDEPQSRLSGTIQRWPNSCI